MGKVWMLVTGVVLIMCMVAGCVEKGVNTYTDPGQVINIGVNEEFVIALDCGDRGSGFDWQANYDGTMLELADSTFYVEDEAIFEDEDFGTQRFKFEAFKFEALKRGETEIIMVYMLLFSEVDKKVFMVNIK